MSAVIPERVETQIQFALNGEPYQPVENVYIQSKIQGMEKFDCKAHYSKLGFKEAVIHYDQKLGLVVRVNDSTIPENRPGILLIPQNYIICIGVDNKY